MALYKAIFKLSGGSQIKAVSGHVPEAFFDSVKKLNADNLILVQQGRFVLSNEVHELLDEPNAYNVYASVILDFPEGEEKSDAFKWKALEKVKQSNYARPLASNINYEIFILEYVDPSFDDD
ncbi:hypothetical protein [Flavobacterium sp.]|uniref:hypothetical protein n=1 Tax=Flavobacterium sp. TaxID=239 RepID=UPI0025C57353|nr:hypothetical protein [Flavobacterium sp.]